MRYCLRSRLGSEQKRVTSNQNGLAPGNCPCQIPRRGILPYATPGSQAGGYLPSAGCQRLVSSRSPNTFRFSGIHQMYHKPQIDKSRKEDRPLTTMLGTTSRGLMSRCSGTRIPGTFSGIFSRGARAQRSQVRILCLPDTRGNPFEEKNLRQRAKKT